MINVTSYNNNSKFIVTKIAYFQIQKSKRILTHVDICIFVSDQSKLLFDIKNKNGSI